MCLCVIICRVTSVTTAEVVFTKYDEIMELLERLEHYVIHGFFAVFLAFRGFIISSCV